MSGIRLATPRDKTRIQELLHQLGYVILEKALEATLTQVLNHPDALTLVYEKDQKVVAVLSMHFIPQLALEGAFARISYFVVDEAFRGQSIGKEMEAFCQEEARKRGCDRIEVHCHQRRTAAHHFYETCGYEESPKYYTKQL